VNLSPAISDATSNQRVKIWQILSESPKLSPAKLSLNTVLGYVHEEASYT